MNVGQRLKKLRNIAGLSQSEVAKKIGVSPQYISKFEAEENPGIAPLLIKALAALYSTSPAYILQAKGFEIYPKSAYNFMGRFNDLISSSEPYKLIFVIKEKHIAGFVFQGAEQSSISTKIKDGLPPQGKAFYGDMAHLYLVKNALELLTTKRYDDIDIAILEPEGDMEEYDLRNGVALAEKIRKPGNYIIDNIALITATEYKIMDAIWSKQVKIKYDCPAPN